MQEWMETISYINDFKSVSPHLERRSSVWTTTQAYPRSRERGRGSVEAFVRERLEFWILVETGATGWLKDIQSQM